MMGQIEILKIDFKQLTNISVKNEEFLIPQEEKTSEEIFDETRQKTLDKTSKKNLQQKEQSFDSISSETISPNNFQTGNLIKNSDALDKLLNKRIIRCAEHYKEIIK